MILSKTERTSRKVTIFFWLKEISKIIVTIFILFSFIFPISFAQTVIFNEPFDNFDNWSPSSDNGAGCTWTVVNGAAKIATMGYNDAGWIYTSYETPLPQTIPPGTDFILKAHIRVMDGDPSGWLSGVGVQLMDNANNRVVRINFNDSQAASGYGGLQYSTGLGMVYTNDPNGFSTNNPTLDGVLEIRRTGTTWTAYLDGQQLGTPQTFDVQRTATKVQITNGQYRFFHYRDGEIDDITIELPGGPSNLTCFYAGSGADSSIIQALNELGFSTTFSTTWPSDLSSYDLVICHSYSMCTPTYASLIGNYVTNGGGALLYGGTPSSFGGGGYSCSNIAEWFGTANYANVGDCVAKINYDHPLGSNLFKNDTVAVAVGWGAAAVSNVYSDCDVLSSYTTGPVHTFIREYGAGRVGFNGGTFDNNASYILIKEMLAWLARINSTSYLTVTPQTADVQAAAGSVTFSVSSNVNWSVTDTASWLSASKTNSTTITAGYQENITTTGRTALITVSGPGVVSQTVQVTQQGAAPFLNVSPDSVNVGSGSGNTTFTVNSNVSWSFTEGAAWITAVKTDSSSLNVSYQQNMNTSLRTALITVSGSGVPDKIIRLTQQGAPPFLTVTPSTLTVGAGQDTSFFSVSSNVTWNVTPGNSWVSVYRKDTNSFSLICEENLSTQSRLANITVSGNGVSSSVVTLTQQGALPYLNVSPVAVSVSNFAGDTIVSVQSNIDWNATTGDTWINPVKISPDSLLLHYNENIATALRQGTITVSGTGVSASVITLSQAGAAPYATVSDTLYLLSSNAGTLSITVSSNITWTVTSNDSWINAVKSNASTITVNYNQNSSTSSREGSIIINGPGITPDSVHFTQQGVEPNLNVSPTVLTIPASSGDTVLHVTSTVAWSVSSNKSWVTASKADTSTINIHYNINPSVDDRAASIAVDGTGVETQYTTITQSGAIPELTVSPVQLTVNDSVGDTLLTVTSNVAWQFSTTAQWISVTKTDSTHLKVSYSPNPYTVERNAIIVVSGSNVSSVFINITQQAAIPYLSVDSTSLHLYSGGGNISFGVRSNVDWQVSDNCNWLIVEKLNATTINIHYNENINTSSRSGLITVSGPNITSQIIDVIQAGAVAYMQIDHTHLDIGPEDSDTTITVYANIDWSVCSSTAWITCVKTGPDVFTVDFDANPQVVVREGSFQLCGPGVDTLLVTVSQMKAEPFIQVTTELINLPYYEKDTVIQVSSNIPWSLSSPVNWLNLVKIDSVSFQIHSKKNRKVQPRTGQIFIVGSEGITDTIKVMQEAGLPYLNADRYADTVSAQKGTINFKISSNISWTVTHGAEWIEAMKIDSVTLQVHYEMNTTGNNRSAYINISGTGVDNLIITLVQEPMKRDLSIEWISPESVPMCGTFVNQEIEVKIHNYGTTTVSGFSVTYSIKKNEDVNSVSEYVYNSILPGEEMVYSFAQKADMSKPGLYNCKALISLTGDQNKLNDTSNTVVTNHPIEIITESYATTCNSATGAILIEDIRGGASPYRVFWTIGDTVQTYEWNPDSSNVMENLPSGTYTITVSDSRGCTNTLTTSVDDAGGPQIVKDQIRKRNVSCSGRADGSIDITVVAGTKPYVFNWSNGASTEDIENLSKGIYSVSVTDNNGCKVSYTDTIIEENPIWISAMVNDAHCGMSDGSVGLEVSGGYPPYTYLWSNGDTIPNPDSLSGGIYTVEVTDTVNCTSVKNVVISENGAPELGLIYSKPADCGLANGELSISVNGDTSNIYDNYKILWDTGNPNDTLRRLENLPVGTYTVSVTDRNEICKAVEQYEVLSKKFIPPAICVVTVDSILERNEVVLKLPADTILQYYKYYNLYREGNQINVYDKIDTIKVSEGNIFIDTLANPRIKPWRYKISATDICGNETDLSLPHKTIHLLANVGINNEVNLIWTGYEGFEYSTYYIYRYSQQGYDTIAEVAGQTGIGGTYTDLNPPAGLNEYFVEVHTQEACPTGSKTSHNSSRSNRKKLAVTGVSDHYLKSKNKMSLGIFPNPSKGTFYLTYKLNNPELLLLRILDINGRLLYEKELEGISGNHKEEFNLHLYPGIYHLQVIRKNEIINKPLVIE